MAGKTPVGRLTKTQREDLKRAKSAMSARYLKGQPALVASMSRSLRAAPGAARTHNVVGVGVDEKYVAGAPAGVSVVKFLVKTKIASSALSPSERLPKSIDGIPTDVEEVGLIVPLAKKKAPKKPKSQEPLPNPRIRMRPAQPGSSIGFQVPNDAFTMAGTFGLLVKDASGRLQILSNNHVLTFENGVETDGTTRVMSEPGAPIFQPGLLDFGSIAIDQIARLTRWIDLRADAETNKVDCAIAKPLGKSLVSKDVLFIGAPKGSAAATKDMVVHKFGRTSLYTAGRVSSVFFDVTVPYEVGDVMFQDQMAIRGLDGSRFSDGGDSGAAILERSTNKVVGLLFAGATNGSLSFANHIGDVFKKLKVRLA